MQVGFVGLGNMGSALANVIGNNGYEVLGWEYDNQVVKEINARHTNSKYLPGIEISPIIRATNNLQEVMKQSDILFVAIPSIFIRRTLQEYGDKVKKKLIIVNLAKGIEAETCLTSCQVLQFLFPDNEIIMLSGPSIANEFVRGKPTVVMLAGDSMPSLLYVSRIIDCNYFRTRFSHDIIGVELGGILKNIYAIGLGMFDGLGIKSVNFRSAYLTIALEEMTKVGCALGAKKETFFYFSGLGDLLATSLSEHSHNRRMGELLASGFSLEAIKEKMGVLPEGYNTLKNTLYIAEKLHISIPLASHLWNVLTGREKVEKFIYSFIKDFVEEE